MDRQTQRQLFDILYALADRDGREAALFGRSLSFAREAFARSIASELFPEVWFEIPLAGDPWFDLHLLTSRDALNPGMVFSAEDTGSHPQVFEWFAKQEGVRQLALSWDVGKGNTTLPAVQVLVTKSDPEIPYSFLRAVGQSGLQDAYRTFTEHMPHTWFACYTGVFPNRECNFVRVECIPSRRMQHVYAQDASLLEAHLRQIGICDLGKTIVSRCQMLARLPFQIEFQFDVMPDGTPGPTFSASARFACPPGEDGWSSFDQSGAAGELMKSIETWGLASDRWRMLADTIFAKRITQADTSCILFNFPAFVKLRWRGGEPLDAKVYLLAGAQL